MDVWKPRELAMMKYGGNQRLADYLDEHGPKDWRKLKITEKYNTKACIAYREQLKAEISSGAPPPEKKASAQKAPAPAPAPQAKTSLFDLFESADMIVDSLMTPSSNKKQSAAEVQKPVRSADKQKQLDLAAAELKRLQAQDNVTKAPANPYATQANVLTAPAKPCAVEAAKPDVKAAPAVDIWGDDLWD